MKKDTMFKEKLIGTGIPDDMILQYQHYLDCGNKQGQKRLLYRFRRIQNDALKRDREKLACLDYIIAKIENTERMLEGK